LNEQAFIHALRQGDPLAFKQLVESWQNMVYNTVLGIVQDHTEAEDIAQEVFIQVYQSIRGFRGDAKLSTWLYRIAVSKALDAERKKKARKRMADLRSWIGLGEKEATAVHFHHPGVQLDNKEKATILFQAIRKIPENQRIAFTLVKTEGLSYEEVAAIMNLSVKAIESLMHRAKENLRKQLQAYYNR
jgi:RNA polymerase sigma factor (sigma-70 family)